MMEFDASQRVRARVMFEDPTWAGVFFGEFGRVETDGDRFRCHVCGEWYHHLIAHASPAHGLNAVGYRRAFGLAVKTKLVGATYHAKRVAASGDHMREMSRSHGFRAGSLTAEERSRRSLKAVRRTEHTLNPTEPERARFMSRARLGSDDGYPVEMVDGFAREFVTELERGQRGVYARLGMRWGVGWSTARSRVWVAVKRGRLIWTGSDHAPDGHLPGDPKPGPRPGSFDERVVLYQVWVAETGPSHVPRGTVYRGVNLRSWLDSQRIRYRLGSLTKEQVQALERIQGWWWSKRGT